MRRYEELIVIASAIMTVIVIALVFAVLFVAAPVVAVFGIGFLGLLALLIWYGARFAPPEFQDWFYGNETAAKMRSDEGARRR